MVLLESRRRLVDRRLEIAVRREDTEGERAALDAHPLLVESELVAAGQDLPRERLVELDHVDVAELQPCTAQGDADRRDEPPSGQPRVDPGGGHGEDPQAGPIQAMPR